MSWKDNLVPASFRGVPFKINSSSVEFGRRSVETEYPLRDTPYSEDLGRKKQEFTIEAFVIGDDYIQQRDRLIRACEQVAGIGRLEHPYFGTKFVVCKSCRVSETTEEGRMARISLTFVEAGERKFPAASKNFFSRLTTAAENLKTSSVENFSNSFLVAGYPNFVLEQATQNVQSLTDALKGLKGSSDQAADFTFKVQSLFDNFAELAQTPADLGLSVVDAIGGVGSLGFDFDGTVSAYKKLFHFGKEEEQSLFSPPESQVSTSRQQINANRNALISLVVTTAVANASVAAVEKSRQAPKPSQIPIRDFTPLDPLQVSSKKVYPAYEDIIAERQEFLDVIEAEAKNTGSDDVYQNLQSHKRALVQAFPDPDLDLPNLLTIVNAQTLPSLVIAYDLYEKLEMEVDLLKRNQVQHPGFVPGGVLLQVINNG